MAQHRQSGMDRPGVRGHDFHPANGSADQTSIAIRGSSHSHPKGSRHRRSSKLRRISFAALFLVLAIVFLLSILSFCLVSRDPEGKRSSLIQDDDGDSDDAKNDLDFLTNVTRTDRYKVLRFGHGSVAHGRDSRYWDGDDRRRDGDYNEEMLEHFGLARSDDDSRDGSHSVNVENGSKEFSSDGNVIVSDRSGIYNEQGRKELKMYEAEYEASLRNSEQSSKGHGNEELAQQNEDVRIDDEYDDGLDFHDAGMQDYENKARDHSYAANADNEDSREYLNLLDKGIKGRAVSQDGNSFEDSISFKSQNNKKINTTSMHVNGFDGHSIKMFNPERQLESKKKPKRRKFSGSSCALKLLNSTAQLVEPLESQKFVRFSLQYTEVENPDGQEHWEPRFAGHQTLQEREKSFLANDQKINCGFVKGPKRSPSTGFDLAEDDTRYISNCHIAVISCIFGNSDRLRSPTGKSVTHLSRKNVCFVMFVDEITLQTLSSEGQSPDRTGFIGLWRIVVVKNLPYSDMRRVGKIPKLLPHRLFPSARYSIWLDSKLRLQVDPLLVLEYLLWRKGYEFAISNHYDRHCLWEEVAQNKKLNKFNHTIIDQQFAFYQADGLKRFNSSDPKKLLPSNVPEGSFIVRAHTPMTCLFSCLWFNEVERFTPRDQLSFAYTYQKLRRMNPGKPFRLSMFKDCERRAMAKLFHHRSDEKRGRVPRPVAPASNERALP